jgi:hypothetical protein
MQVYSYTLKYCFFDKMYVVLPELQVGVIAIDIIRVIKRLKGMHFHACRQTCLHAMTYQKW